MVVPAPSTHVIPRHIAVVNHSTKADDVEVAYWVEACNIKLRNEVAPKWDKEPPGVFFYGPAAKIPSDQAAVIGIVDDDGNADSAGYHAAAGSLIYGLVDMGQARVPSRTLDHEVNEMYGNCRLDRWAQGPLNRNIAVELNDFDQRTGYEVKVTLFGETRSVTVSNFAYPAWFGDGAGPYDRLGRARAPFEILPGGYAIAEEDGQILFLPSRTEGIFMNSAKMNRTSRTRRIIEIVEARALLNPPTAPR